MKTDVTRNFSGKTARKIGEAPNLGRVPRTPESGTSRKRRAPHGSSRRRRKRRVTLAWSLVFAVLAACVLMFFIISSFLKPASSPAPGTRSPDAARSSPETKTPAPEPPGEAASLELVQSALSNRDPDKVEDFFRLPADKTSDDAIRTLARIEKEEGAVSRTQWLGTAFANGTMMVQVVVHMESNGRSVNRLAQLVPQGEGEWRIDFDSYTRASSADWESILSGKSPLATVRVFVSHDTYYNGFFADDTVWQAYALVSPDADVILYAYAKRGSAQFLAMSKILEAEESLHRATLEIANVPGAGRRQFQISRVRAENWVVGEKPFDESF